MKMWSWTESQEFAILAKSRVTAYSPSYKNYFAVYLLLNFIAKITENRDVMVATVEILETSIVAVVALEVSFQIYLVRRNPLIGCNVKLRQEEAQEDYHHQHLEDKLNIY